MDGERVYGERDCLTNSYGSKNAERVGVFLFNCASGFVVPDRCLRERCDGVARGAQGGELSPTTSWPPSAPR